MTPSSSQGGTVRFGVFELDPAAGELRKRGVRTRLPYQPFQVLLALLERPGDIVTHQELIERLWPNGTVVEYEHSLATAVHKIREALGDSADNPRFIATVRKGYRFVAPVDGRLEPAAPWSPRPGATISHYRIVEKLGEGNMGVVYKARDNNLERTVALKFIAPQAVEDSEHKARFLREAKAAAQLDHPNICPIHEIDEVDGNSFFSMAYISGRTVKDRIGRHPFKIEEALDVAIQAAQGLKAAHERGIVHRDIKSGNLMIAREGAVKIVDFGIAQFAEGTALTKEGASLGTPLYMSPEQVQGRPLDGRTDIWSLGVVLYEMLAGQVPFPGDAPAAVGYAILHKDPQRLGVRRANVPGELERIAEKALAKDPAKRYQQADAFLKDLQRVRAQIAAVVPPKEYAPAPQPTSWLSRAALAVPVLILGAVAAWAIIVPHGTLRPMDADPDKAPSDAGELRPPSPAWPEARRVAMLRFETEGGEEEQALADGLLEMISRRLARLERFDDRLVVFPVSEILDQSVREPTDAHKTFGATLGVVGDLSLDDEHLGLSLRFVDAKTLRELGATRITGDRLNLQAFQTNSVRAIAPVLGVELSDNELDELNTGPPPPPGVYELYVQGLGYLTWHKDTLNNTNRAVEKFEDAISKDPTYALAHAAQCQAFATKSRYDLKSSQKWLSLANASCEKGMALDDGLSEVHMAAGLLATAGGDHHRAITTLQKSLEIRPRNVRALYLLAYAFQGLGLFEQAENALVRAIELRRQYWRGYNQLGLFYFKRGRYKDAVLQFRKVVDLTPDSARGYLDLGSALYYSEEFIAARMAFEISQEIGPQFRTASSLGELYYQEGRTNDAIVMYRVALKINESHHLVWGNLGDAYADLPEGIDESQAYYEKALELALIALDLNPHHPATLSYVALYAARLNRKAEAARYIIRALRQPSLAPTDMIRAAKVFEVLRERHRAIEWLVKAVNSGYSLDVARRQPALRAVGNDPALLFQLDASAGALPSPVPTTNTHERIP